MNPTHILKSLVSAPVSGSHPRALASFAPFSGNLDYWRVLWGALLMTQTSSFYFLSCPDCSGKLDDYWRVLWEAGSLNAEKMAKFQNPITATPLHLPHLANGEAARHLASRHT